MYLSLSHKFGDKFFTFNKVFGILTSRRDNKSPNYHKTMPDKAEALLGYVENPYIIVKDEFGFENVSQIGRLAMYYAKLLMFSYRHFYPLLWLLSYLRLNIFENAVSAIKAFCLIYPSNQHILCLPRSIFAATTSKAFKDSGAVFIGVFHPSHHMHAWIIENGQNPCRFDYDWINFTPVLMII